VGFAGLAQTTVERLAREGGTRDEDAESSALPQAAALADLRHVLGGHCTDDSVDARVGHLRDAITSLRRVIERHGGGASRLHDVVTQAEDYLAGSATERAARDDAGWQALRSVLAYHIPRPDWSTCERDATDRMSGGSAVLPSHALLEPLAQANAAAAAIRDAWKARARRELARREAMEAGRDVARVILRAWREVTDGIRAGAARWEQDWAAGSEVSARAPARGANGRAGGGAGGCARCVLARRLEFGEGAGTLYAEVGWPVRVMLAWQRLVRAGKIRRLRMRRGSAWLEGEAARIAAGLRGLPTQAAADEAGLPSSMRSYTWADEEAIAAEHHITSGAACVRARRASRASGGAKRKAAQPPHTANTADDVVGAGVRERDAGAGTDQQHRKSARHRRHGAGPSRALASPADGISSSFVGFLPGRPSFLGDADLPENLHDPQHVLPPERGRPVERRARRGDSALILTGRAYGMFLRVLGPSIPRPGAG